MTAMEYYNPSAGSQPSLTQQPYPPQHSQYQFQRPSNQISQPFQSNNQPPPPAYSEYNQQPGYQHQQFPQQTSHSQYPQHAPPQISVPPYPELDTMKPQYFPPPPKQSSQSDHLGAPLQHHRSHSQPPRVQRVRFEDELYDSDSSDGRSIPSDSDHSTRHRRRRKNRDSHSRSYDRSRSRSSSLDRDRDHHHSRHHKSRSERREKDRNTFLGAGVGGLIGDAIVPGLGTAAGLLLGGYGARQHTKKRRSRSDAGDERYYPHRGRAEGEGGWDKDSATFRMGHAVR
ncbi:hypothetical protein BU24DRAFT_409491 [Aaosphaeria arxii CBS 175.79]|uniref:Uncharacterized protein n=1 Tax=Aaosphaeria arxii CBS 175.79 TaxID=1450172 RepID=A0A6A5XUA1_9PLEO|nr:uncharacterized protein BU24DRAFT_409491 [Aaosphaeria arxii CBS 175.79]KAF2016387.1 hypothetical protein BU24DRAFT_409491 [Aaosphaeria arxii CBS 175.79]